MEIAGLGHEQGQLDVSALSGLIPVPLTDAQTHLCCVRSQALDVIESPRSECGAPPNEPDTLDQRVRAVSAGGQRSDYEGRARSSPSGTDALDVEIQRLERELAALRRGEEAEGDELQVWDRQQVLDLQEAKDADVSVGEEGLLGFAAEADEMVASAEPQTQHCADSPHDHDMEGHGTIDLDQAWQSTDTVQDSVRSVQGTENRSNAGNVLREREAQTPQQRHENKGVWADGNAAQKLFAHVTSLGLGQPSSADKKEEGKDRVDEAVRRAQDLLQQAARANPSVPGGIVLDDEPDWLKPVDLDAFLEHAAGGVEAVHDSKSDAFADPLNSFGWQDDEGGAAEEWDGDLAWAVQRVADPDSASSVLNPMAKNDVDPGIKEDGLEMENKGTFNNGGHVDFGTDGIDTPTSFVGAGLGEDGTWKWKEAWELWDIVQGRGSRGLGYTVLRHREFGSVVELFHDSDDGFFRVLPGHAVPRDTVQRDLVHGQGVGEPLWSGEYTRPIFMCARWGDFWLRRSFNAPMLVRHVMQHAGSQAVAFPRKGVAAGLFTIQVQGPLLRVTWALDAHTSVRSPALSFLTPEGVVHFGSRSIVMISQGRDPQRLPRYMLDTPRELLPEHRRMLRHELQARLDWYLSSAGDQLRLGVSSITAGDDDAEVGLAKKSGHKTESVVLKNRRAKPTEPQAKNADCESLLPYLPCSCFSELTESVKALTHSMGGLTHRDSSALRWITWAQRRLIWRREGVASGNSSDRILPPLYASHFFGPPPLSFHPHLLQFACLNIFSNKVFKRGVILATEGVRVEKRKRVQPCALSTSSLSHRRMWHLPQLAS